MIYYWAVSEKGKHVRFYDKSARDKYVSDNPERHKVKQGEYCGDEAYQREYYSTHGGRNVERKRRNY